METNLPSIEEISNILQRYRAEMESKGLEFFCLAKDKNGKSVTVIFNDGGNPTSAVANAIDAHHAWVKKNNLRKYTGNGLTGQ